MVADRLGGGTVQVVEHVSGTPRRSGAGTNGSTGALHVAPNLTTPVAPGFSGRKEKG
jgi:hypothetical protein